MSVEEFQKRVLESHMLMYKHAEFTNLKEVPGTKDYFNAFSATVTHSTEGLKLPSPFQVIFFLHKVGSAIMFTLKSNTITGGWLGEGNCDELTLLDDAPKIENFINEL